GAVRLAGLRGLAHRVERSAASELPFPRDEFDAVCDVQCLQHLSEDEQEQAYREIQRVLVPNGRFFSMYLVAGQGLYPGLSFTTWKERRLERALLKVV